MTTVVIYIDEAGSPERHHDPIVTGETPLFCLVGLALPLADWRLRDRGYFRLKRQFFPDMMGKPGKRDEEVEIKGRDLTSPRQSTSSRRQEFNRRTLAFIDRCGGRAFGVSFLKSSASPMSAHSMYCRALQILVERVSVYVAESALHDHAILICDSRMKGISGQDIEVARSHMSYIFGNETGRTFTNIVEAPLFADSRLTVGLQLADVVVDDFLRNLRVMTRELTVVAVPPVGPTRGSCSPIESRSQRNGGGPMSGSFPAPRSRPIVAALVLWLGIAIAAGASGRLAALRPPAPQLVLAALTVAVLLAVLLLPSVRPFAFSVDPRVLVGLHLTRFVAGVGFLARFRRGELPFAFAVPGGYGDILVATLALVLLLIGPPSTPGRRAVYAAWNLLGLADILFVVATAARLAIADPASMAALQRLPLSLLPTFLVPLIIASHIVLGIRLSGRHFSGRSIHAS